MTAVGYTLTFVDAANGYQTGLYLWQHLFFDSLAVANPRFASHQHRKHLAEKAFFVTLKQPKHGREQQHHKGRHEVEHPFLGALTRKWQCLDSYGASILRRVDVDVAVNVPQKVASGYFIKSQLKPSCRVTVLLSWRRKSHLDGIGQLQLQRLLKRPFYDMNFWH